jgi:uncharacterized membrane protein
MVGLFAFLALVVAVFAIGALFRQRGRIEDLERKVERLEREALRSGDGWSTPREVAPPPAATPSYREPIPPPVARAPVPTERPPPPPRVAPVYEKEGFTPPAMPPRAPAPSPTSPPPRRAPVDTDEFPDIVDALRDWFFGGNLVVRVGVLVLFIGVGFLLKFAVDRNLLPIEVRLAAAALGGVALLVIGWRLRLTLRAYSLALQGGGVGLLYLTAFAALRFYELLPPAVTFVLMVAVAALSTFLAVSQNALVLAVLGALGGYLAPILTSTGQGNHVALFGFYALLDAAIVAVAWFKAWRPLNLLAFAFTYGIGTAWGVLRYEPAQFATTEPFVILFFLLFLAASILFALRAAPRLADYVDGTLVFGTPVVTMALQSALVHDRPYATAISSFVLGVFYLVLARAAWSRAGGQLRLLAECFLALGIAFVTLAVPLAFDGHWTAATWALEGAAILWIGLRQDRSLAVVSGIALQFVAAVAFVVGHDVVPVDVPLANSQCVGALALAIGGLACARAAHVHREGLSDEFAWIAIAPFYWALAWWTYAGMGEIFEFVPDEHGIVALLGFAIATVVGCAALSHWDDWRVARGPTWWLLPAMGVLFAADIAERGHWLAGVGGAGWLLAFACWFGLLRWRTARVTFAVEPALHVATLWFVVLAGALELGWRFADPDLDTSWRRIAHGLVPALALFAVSSAAARARWPVASQPGAYAGVGAFGLAAVAWLWVLRMCFDRGVAPPFGYLPILNPVEIAQGVALAAVARWFVFLERDAVSDWVPADVRRALVAAWAFAVFSLLNAILLRTIHHHAGIGYEPGALMESTLVQASLSIFWGVLALVAMVVGAHRGQRIVWFVGAWLLGIALAKMFLVDLSRSGTVARIVSFIGVGVLMLIIGRFSPVPPAQERREPAHSGSG